MRRAGRWVRSVVGDVGDRLARDVLYWLAIVALLAAAVWWGGPELLSRLQDSR